AVRLVRPATYRSPRRLKPAPTEATFVEIFPQVCRVRPRCMFENASNTQEMRSASMEPMISRREVIFRLGVAAGTQTFIQRSLTAEALQSPPSPQRVGSPSVISNPPRDFTPGAQPVTYPDPDVITIDPAFRSLRVDNTPIQRLWTGGLWCEGPAWCSQGRYLVWSDIPNNRQMRWLEEEGRVTVF